MSNRNRRARADMAQSISTTSAADILKQNNVSPGAPVPAKSSSDIVLFERGTSGLREFSGFVTEAYNTQLMWPTVEPLYRKLIRSAPEIVVIRQAFTTWARGVDLKCNLPKDANEDDIKLKDAWDQAMMDMEGGVDKLKETMVANVPFYGWGWWEVVPGIRDSSFVPPTLDEESPDPWRSNFDDGLIGFRRLAFRAPSSFYRWQFDRRKRLTGMIQRDWPAMPPVVLPLDQSLHLTFGDPNNPEGLTPLEAVWRLERLRFGYEVTLGIGAEHAAGHMKFMKTKPGTLSATDLRNVGDAARNILSAAAGNYFLLPEGLDGDVKDITFQAGQTIMDAIQHYSILMFMVYMMSFIGLNTMTGTGSKGATSDVSQLGVVNFNSMMQGFASQIQNQLFKRFYQWNKDSFPQSKGMHTLSFTEVSKDYALTDLGSFIAQYGALFNMGEEDAVSIRKRSGFLPEALPDEALTKTDAQKVPPAPVIQQPPVDPNAAPAKLPGEFSQRAELARELMKTANYKKRNV